MFRALDNLIIDRLDRLTLRLQKRGLNLVQAQVHVAGLVLLTHTGVSITPKVQVPLLLFNGLIWGGLFLLINFWASQNKDYREDWRKANRLNAVAVVKREKGIFWRMMLIYLSMVGATFVGIDIWFGDIKVAQMIFRVICTPILTLLLYLETCTYIAGIPVTEEAPADAAAEGSQI